MLPETDADRRHFEKCSTKECPQCYWAAHKKRWQKRLPWVYGSSDPAQGGFFLGCRTCNQAGRMSVYGSCSVQPDKAPKFFQFQHAANHEKSKAHRAVAGEPGLGDSVAPGSGRVTPSAEDFRTVMAKVRRNQGFGDKGIEGVGGRTKVRRMKFCLAEGFRSLARKWVASAETLSLHRDARQTTLLVRFHGCNSALESASGIFGVLSSAEKFNLSAEGIRASTLCVIKQFCLPRRCPPGCKREAAGISAVTPLFKHVCKIIEHDNTDAASDERLSKALLKAGRLTMTSPTSARPAKKCERFPNLKVTSVDTTHAARRVLKRGWDADEYLKDTAELFVFDPASFAQRARHSHLFGAMFKRNVQAMESDALHLHRIHSLKAAKHRMESTQKPFGRMVLCFPAVLLTNEQIANQRRGQAEGRVALDYHNLITAERALQFAMMADAGDENSILVRFCDRGDACPAEELASECQTFVDRIVSLFTHGRCERSGYTKYMLSLLEEGITTFVHGEPRTLGGRGAGRLTDEARARALGRMQNWVTLIKSALAAEFPDFSILRALGIFELPVDASKRPDVPPESFTRLAKLCHVSKEHFKAQFEDFWPLAVSIKNAKATTNKEAWVTAVAKTSRARRAHPASALIPVLSRLVGWSWSTSTVERTFALGKWISCNQRAHMPDDLCNDELAILFPLQSSESFDAAAIQAAQAEWGAIYGDCRRATGTRVDVGVPKKRSRDSEGAWLACRRAEVAQLTKEPEGEEEPIAEEARQWAAENWSAEHEREIGFQQQKRREAKIEAGLEGNLVKKELGRGMRRAIRVAKQAKERRIVEYRKAQLRRRRLLAPTQRARLRGARIWVDGVIDEGQARDVDAILDAYKMRRADTAAGAQILLVRDVSMPRRAVKWAAILTGGTLVDTTCIRTEGRRGRAATYQKALASRRRFFVSDGFRQMNPIMTQILESTAPGSRWKQVATHGAAEEQAIAWQSRGRNFSMVAFVTQAEQTGADFRHFYCKLTESDAMEFFGVMDTQRSSRGICGM